jgi:hypothetical protein
MHPASLPDIGCDSAGMEGLAAGASDSDLFKVTQLDRVAQILLAKTISMGNCVI